MLGRGKSVKVQMLMITMDSIVMRTLWYWINGDNPFPL